MNGCFSSKNYAKLSQKGLSLIAQNVTRHAQKHPALAINIF